MSRRIGCILSGGCVERRPNVYYKNSNYLGMIRTVFFLRKKRRAKKGF